MCYGKQPDGTTASRFAVPFFVTALHYGKQSSSVPCQSLLSMVVTDGLSRRVSNASLPTTHDRGTNDDESTDTTNNILQTQVEYHIVNSTKQQQYVFQLPQQQQLCISNNHT